MPYDVALNKAWEELENSTKDSIVSVRFLADEYTVNVKDKKVLSLSCNVPVKDFLVILILHYLVKKSKGLPKITGEWIDFRELDGGQGYYSNFKKRVLKIVIKKYGTNPESLVSLISRFKAKRVELADVAICLEPLEGSPILVQAWKGDDEFSPEANILFDKNIKDIFCTEDIVILSEFLAHSI